MCGKLVMPAEWKATLCAVDGATTQGIPRQIIGIPSNATYLFVSVGGNDALMNMDLLTDMETPGPQLLSKLSMLADVFHKNYDEAISGICKLRKPTYVCTIYNGNLESSISKAAKAAVGVFNPIFRRSRLRFLPPMTMPPVPHFFPRSLSTTFTAL